MVIGLALDQHGSEIQGGRRSFTIECLRVSPTHVPRIFFLQNLQLLFTILHGGPKTRKGIW